MADSISRITSMLETARDLTLEAATAASSRLTIANATRLTAPEISTLLNSRTERDVYQGLKSVIAMISRDEDASKFYTDVVKNVTSSNLKIKRLVYTYLLKYTDESNEDIALLSINAIQKSLYDQDENCRALAMRMISEIRIRSIYQIVIIGLKKCVNDSSPVVRKSAAISIVKIYQNHVDNDTCDAKEDLLPHLERLLKDTEVMVLNSSVLAYKLICPENYSLIHGHFRRFVKMLDQFDEWSQVYLVELFTDYSRKFFARPKIVNLTALAHEDTIDLPDVYNGIPFPVYDVQYHPDLELLLSNLRPLVHSFNESLVMATARAFFHLTPPKTFREAQIPRALVRLVSTGSEDAKVGILQMVLYMVLQDPMNFVEFTKRFYLLTSSDSAEVIRYKLRILSIICNENNIKSIISELQSYIVTSVDMETAIESVKTLGICCQISEFWSGKTLKWMLWELTHNNESLPNLVRSEFLTVIRYLIQKDKQSHINTIVRLALISTDTSCNLTTEAKESIIWILGEFAELIPRLIPDILRQLLKYFHSFPSPIRYQIILLSAKVFISDISEQGIENYDFESSQIAKMYQYAIQLGRYDDVNDIRDRSRFLYSLLSNPEKDHQLASLILQVHKQAPLLLKRGIDPLELTSEEDKKTDIVKDVFSVEVLEDLGLQSTMIQYVIVPGWTRSEDLPSDSIRDEIEVKHAVQNISDKDMVNSNKTSASAYSGGSNGISKPVTSITGRISSLSSTGASTNTKKYNLQSLDDFLNENDDEFNGFKKSGTVFLGKNNKKKIIYEEVTDTEFEEDDSSSADEESSSEEEDEEDDDDSEDDSEREDVRDWNKQSDTDSQDQIIQENKQSMEIEYSDKESNNSSSFNQRNLKTPDQENLDSPWK